jgi:hypothetical protein
MLSRFYVVRVKTSSVDLSQGQGSDLQSLDCHTGTWQQHSVRSSSGHQVATNLLCSPVVANGF